MRQSGGRARLEWALLACTGLVLAGVFIVGQLGSKAKRSHVSHVGDTSAAPGLSVGDPTVQRVAAALGRNDPQRLYPVLAPVTARHYDSMRSFIRDYHRQLSASGRVSGLSVRGPVRSRILRDGVGVGSVIVRMTYGRGTPEQYRAYFLREAGAWRLWFTAPAP